MNALIDIGSNSVRLLIDLLPGTLQQKYVETTALGQGLNTSGRLSIDAMQRTLDAVKRFVDMCRERRAQAIYIFATEAVRSAKNGCDFTQSVFQATGIPVDVIDGDTEAYIGYIGCSKGFPSPALCVDIGGASVELIYGIDNQILYKKSLPLGVQRLKEICGGDLVKLDAYLDRQIPQFQLPQKPLYGIAIGGSATSAAAMVLGLKQYDVVKVHKCVLQKADLQKMYLSLLPLSDDEISQKFPLLGEKRAAVIKYGFAAMLKVLSYSCLDKIFVSEFDNIEGYKVYKNI